VSLNPAAPSLLAARDALPATEPTIPDAVYAARREQVRTFFAAAQDRLSESLAALDGGKGFFEDAWTRPGEEGGAGRLSGGGGRTRVIEGGALFERGGVNFSAIDGTNLPKAITSRRPEAAGHPYFASGTSLVLHPWNPYVPTVHMNVRYFQAGPVWWFGGGADLTPYYPFADDAVLFHRALKAACDRHDVAFYPKFKAWCDEYFYLKHRGETRGIGGIFFDDLGASAGTFESHFAFVQSVVEAFHAAYVEIVGRRRNLDYGERERDFQLYRRGRYVEFNLLWDQGTHFGIQTQGRTESILMSLPAEVRWRYNWSPEPGTPEARLYDTFLKPQDWAAGGP
jgi:coproporphyrinogen III oxidase